MLTRRDLLKKVGAITAAVGVAAVSRSSMAALPEPVIQQSADTMDPLIPNTGRPYNPVVTLNGWTLPWRMNNGVKEFHLVAEPVVREVSPGFKVRLPLAGQTKPSPSSLAAAGGCTAGEVAGFTSAALPMGCTTTPEASTVALGGTTRKTCPISIWWGLGRLFQRIKSRQDCPLSKAIRVRVSPFWTV